jgi:hypothetical protein
MKNKTSIYFIVAISLFVGLLHFLIGPNYQGILKGFIRGYLIDILLPLNLYLLLQLSLRKRLAVKNARIIAALFVFTFGVFVEVLQFYQVAIFGTTYDPRDIVMYGVGVGSGVLIDLTVINYFESR